MAMSRTRSDPRDRINPGLAEALRLRKLPARRPTEADAPAPNPLPGPKVKPLKGQLDFFGIEIGATPKDERLDDEWLDAANRDTDRHG